MAALILRPPRRSQTLAAPRPCATLVGTSAALPSPPSPIGRARRRSPAALVGLPENSSRISGLGSGGRRRAPPWCWGFRASQSEGRRAGPGGGGCELSSQVA